MLRASALYIVIIIALVISVLCSAVIVAGYYYRSVYQQNFRYDQLKNNLQSGVNVLLANGDAYQAEKKISLFNGDTDSLILYQATWGLFEVGKAKAFIQTDTLSKCLMMANAIDSVKWAALYVIDEDRSLSVSGKTHIRGNAFLPKAGIKEAYVNNQAYTGDKSIVTGAKKTSEKSLPPLLDKRIKNLETLRMDKVTSEGILGNKDSIVVSFFRPTLIHSFKKKPVVLSDIKLSGNIMLVSDTTITIDHTTKLDNVIVFAPDIVVKSGFNGYCQLFASASITVEDHCVFGYPSCLGVVNFGKDHQTIKRLDIGDFSTIQGSVFISDANSGKFPPTISLGKGAQISGQVYVQGLVNLKDEVKILGGVFTNRFIYQSTYTRYENYLINLDIDALKLSPYYLSSDLFPVAGKKTKGITMAAINKKLRASSVLEVIISMIVILVIFGIAMMIFTNVTQLSLSDKKLRAEALVKKNILSAERSGRPANDSLIIDGFKLRTAYKNNGSLVELTVTAFDENGQQIAQLKKLIID